MEQNAAQHQELLEQQREAFRQQEKHLAQQLAIAKDVQASTKEFQSGFLDFLRSKF